MCQGDSAGHGRCRPETRYRAALSGRRATEASPRAPSPAPCLASTPSSRSRTAASPPPTCHAGHSRADDLVPGATRAHAQLLSLRRRWLRAPRAPCVPPPHVSEPHHGSARLKGQLGQRPARPWPAVHTHGHARGCLTVTSAAGKDPAGKGCGPSCGRSEPGGIPAAPRELDRLPVTGLRALSLAGLQQIRINSSDIYGCDCGRKL